MTTEAENGGGTAPPEGDPPPDKAPRPGPGKETPSEPPRKDPPPQAPPQIDPPKAPAPIGDPVPGDAPHGPPPEQAVPAEAGAKAPAEPPPNGAAPAKKNGALFAHNQVSTDEQELAEAAQTEMQALREAARFATPERVRSVIEALLFAAEKPLDASGLADLTQFETAQVETALVQLKARYGGAAMGVGVLLSDVGGKLQLRTDPDVGAYVRRMLQVKPMRLTRAALETLAIISYRQPITRPEMEDLRGVDCGAVCKALLERKLIRILGKKDEPGRPLLYGTTREFLELFNLRDLTQLPTLREFQELSEESRKIVEEEAPAPALVPLEALQVNHEIAERMAKATAESDSALEQLEKAMSVADEQTKTAAAVLAPPAPAVPPAAPSATTGAPPATTEVPVAEEGAGPQASGPRPSAGPQASGLRPRQKPEPSAQ